MTDQPQGPDPRDYLAQLALGVGVPGAPHVWDRDLRSDQRSWHCKWCGIEFDVRRATENCPKHPPDVVRLNG